MTYFTIGWIALTFIIPFALRKRGIQEAQMVATTLGILGTFIGIVYGLLHFDTGNIADAVPLLLNGLKFAFITSIAGMMVSLLFGLFPKLFGFTSSEEEANKNKSESELLAELLSEMKVLNASIAGDNDTTLITQIQKMRTSIVDKQDELKKAFDEFASQMAKNNIEQLIEAINKVMEDFNAKINDQLGQSFKELSDSVRSLVEWQQNYVTTVQTATEALGSAQESLKSSSESLNNTSEKVSDIAENNKKISELNQELQVVVQNLNEMLESTVGFSQSMKVLAESLNGSGDTLKSELSALVKESVASMQEHADGITKNINAISETAFNNMQEKNEETLKNFENINQKTLQNFGEHLASIAGKMAEDFARVQEALKIK